MAQIVKVVSVFQAETATRANSTYAVPNFSMPYLYTSTDWDPTPTVYFEAVLASSAGTASAELRNVTDGSTPTGAEVTTTSTSATRVRSAAITLTTGKEYQVRIKSTGGADTCTIYAARIIFIQNGTIVKTETVYEFGGNSTSASTTYGVDTSKNEYYHDTTALGGTVTVYFEGYLSQQTATNTAYQQLSDGSSAVSGSEVTETGSTDARKRSGAITLTNATAYELHRKTDPAGTVRSRAGRIIILQTDSPTSTLSFYPLKTGLISASSTPVTRTAKLLWDADEWSVTSTSIYHEAWMAPLSGDTATCELYDGTTADDSRTRSSTGQNRDISGTLSLTDGDEFDARISNSDASNASFYASYLRIHATYSGGGGGGTAVPVFVHQLRQQGIA